MYLRAKFEVSRGGRDNFNFTPPPPPQNETLKSPPRLGLNACLRLLNGCIKSTPTELLPILFGIEPMNIRRNKNMLIFHQTTISPFTNGRLTSRMPLPTCKHHLSHDIENISPGNWGQHAWRGRWEKSIYQLNDFIACPSSKLPGYDLKRSQWVLLNRLRSGHVRYASFMWCNLDSSTRTELQYDRDQR